jgi:DNA polymerase III alpha subunit
MGIEVLGPDINQSRLPYTGSGKTIRTGFQQLQAIKKNIIEAILRERSRAGPFSSIEDFLDRVRGQNGLPISAPDSAILTRSGAMDSISGAFNRPQILWFIEAWLNAFRAPQTNCRFQTSVFHPSSYASQSQLSFLRTQSSVHSPLLRSLPSRIFPTA